MKTHYLLILLLLYTWRVLAKEYTSREGARRADVKISLNDNFAITASNSGKFYMFYFMLTNSVKISYKIDYDKDDIYVYSLAALKIKSDQIVSFVQVVKNTRLNSVLLSRISINLAEFHNSMDILINTRIDRVLNLTGQGHILIKIDPQEKYAYVFADSLIMSYNLLTNEIYQKNKAKIIHCDGDNGSFIPYAVDLKNTWAAMTGFHRIQDSSYQKPCFYVFELQSLNLIQARGLAQSYVQNSESIGYHPESIMSISINPSGTMIAIGQAQLDTVTIAFMVGKETSTNISAMFQITEDVKLIDFGRSVTWLDDNGTLAILVGKSANRTGLESEIQIYTSISSTPTKTFLLPKFVLPNNQQPLHKIPYQFGWRRRSFLHIFTQARNLLILRDDGILIHIPSSEPGFSSMEPMKINELRRTLLSCFDNGACLPLSIAVYREFSPRNESSSMIYFLLSKSCVSGSYKNVDGFGPCTVCPPGTKNPGDNQSSNCKPCNPPDFCSLGASNEVNLTVFNSTNQVFNYPDSPIIDNYDDVMLLNFIPNTWAPGCFFSSPLFVTIIFVILSFIIWIIMLVIKKRRPTPIDNHRNRAKRILKHTDLVGEGERMAGGLASIVIFAIIIYSIVFAIHYFFSYSSENIWIRKACNDSLRNTNFDNALQLPLPDPEGNDWKIFNMLDNQNFTMIVYLINTGAPCTRIDVQHNRLRVNPDIINKMYCNDSNNNFTTFFNFPVPTHTSTVQVVINGPYFMGALRLCLHGAEKFESEDDEYREIKELNACTLFYTNNQTIGLKTDFEVDLVRVINVTKPLRRSQQTDYSGIWKPIVTNIDDFSDDLYYAKHGEYLRYTSDQTTFTVTFREENYYVQNNQSPIIRRAAITFHTFMFIFLVIDTVAMIFVLYKLWGQPLVQRLVQLCFKSRKNDFQSSDLEMATGISPQIASNPSADRSRHNSGRNLVNNANQDFQQYSRSKSSLKSSKDLDMPHPSSTGQSSSALATAPTVEAIFTSDYLAVDHSPESIDARIDIHAAIIERLLNEVATMQRQNDELNQQIIFLKQSMANSNQYH